MNLYEVHILVNPKEERYLRYFVENNEGYFKNLNAINVKKMTTVTNSEKNHRRPMLIFAIHHETFEEAIQTMKKVSQKIEEEGFEISRRKVMGKQDDSNFPKNVTVMQYYEIHTKITNVNDNHSWEKAARLCSTFGVSLLYEADSFRIRPITTLRCYEMSFDEACGKQADLELALKNNGFQFETSSCEYSFYDDNINADKGWLFKSDPKESISPDIDLNTLKAPRFFHLLAR